MLSELEKQDTIFDLPRRKFWAPDADISMAVDFVGHPASAPVGPAAGPQSQLAQNIVLSWLAGARIVELKTVQINDRLEIPRPCIDAQTIGYNVEWSQELRLQQSLDEYVCAWTLLHILMAENPQGLSKDRMHTIFDCSVGYDLKGIQSENVRAVIQGLKDAESRINDLRNRIPAQFARHKDVEIPSRIIDTITLSTFHGCPADEIEGIVAFLLKEMDVDVIIKMNPTLLGLEGVRGILNDQLGYEHVEVPADAFDHDLKWNEAIDIVERLRGVASSVGRKVGVKFSNTLIVKNHRDFFPKSEEVMYLSGQPLHVITMNLMAKWREHWGSQLPISFSAGIDAQNYADAVACDLVPVTVCTDLLRPGGYARMSKYGDNLAKAMKKVGAKNIREYLINARGHAEKAYDEAVSQLEENWAQKALAGKCASHLEDTSEESNLEFVKRTLKEAASGADGTSDADADRVALHFFDEWARAGGRENTRDLVPLLAENPRYAWAKTQKPPKKVGSELELFDCLNCDKCIPVCPNNANFHYDVDELNIPFKVLVHEGGEVKEKSGGMFNTAKVHQLANYADFCNECGNCDVFCPEDGGPYIVKPRFFSSKDTWDEFPEHDGFYISREEAGDTMWGRVRGQALEMKVDREKSEAQLSDGMLSVSLNYKSGELINAEARSDAEVQDGHELPLDNFLIMRALLEGVLTDTRLNQVNVAFLKTGAEGGAS
jgi:putative selenate reductase